MAIAKEKIDKHPTPSPRKELLIGQRFVVTELPGTTEQKFEIVTDDKADPLTFKLKLSSPLVRALPGIQEGEIFDVQIGTPPNSSTIRYKLIKIYPAEPPKPL